MKKKDYGNKNINDLTASEASHMYTWVLVKSFFIISLICILISAYVALCTYLTVKDKFDYMIEEQNRVIEEFETEKKERKVYLDENGEPIVNESEFVY